MFLEAAGGMVFNEDRQLLAIYRYNKWDLPKGKMEKGETAEESAIREVQEECNIKKMKIIKSLPSTWHIYRVYDKMYLKHTRWYEMMASREEKIMPQEKEGISDIKWFNSEEMDMIYRNTYDSLLDLFEEIKF
jgi:8-oxo-dGTP pyrophosphatase MutT (NUDIX family)